MSAIQTITKQKTQTAVTIKSVKIEKLFEIFDYDIEFADGENVLIITGPNGFGKTTILNILYSLFESEWEYNYSDYAPFPGPFEDFADRPFDFLEKLLFDRISISLSDNNVIVIDKVSEKPNLSFTFYNKNRKLTDDELSIKNGSYQFSKTGYEIINSVEIYLIKEQRLQKKTTIWNKGEYDDYYKTEKHEESIEFHSEKLREIFTDFMSQYNNESQNLDSSFPTRLISEKKIITEEEYNKRFTDLMQKQNRLIQYGLYESKPITLEYSQTDAKALLVYLNDLEKKLSVFDELLAKLDLFTEILNQRRLTFKSIKINRTKGFYFETPKGKKLIPNKLSSGELHQVILLYELIFSTTPNTLVLIDEPEISLHITWQKEFVKDLLKIIELQNFQVMIATHAPAIVNDRWDLVYSLAKTI